MNRFLHLLIGIFLCVMSSNAEVLTINATGTGLSGTAYLTSAETFTVDGITYGINQFNPNTGQMRVNNTGNSAFTFYNTTKIDALKEVRIYTDVSTVGTMYMAVGNAAITSTVATSGIKGVTAAGESSGYVTTFTVPAGTDVEYFKIQITTKGSGTVKASRFEIETDDGTGDLITAPPVISGTKMFKDKTTVSITAEDGASIYYTTDGTEPTVASTVYTSPFDITETTTVTAIAKTEGKEESSAVSVTFTKSTPWKLITSADELDTDGRYILASGRFAVSTAAVVSNKLQSTAAEYDNGDLLLSENMMVFTLQPAETGYYLKSNNYNNTTSDIFLTISSSSGTNVNMGTPGTEIFFTYDAANSYWKIQKATSDTRTLMFNESGVCGYYSTSNLSTYLPLQIYKEDLGMEECSLPEISITPAAVFEGEDAKVSIVAGEGESVRYTIDGSTPSATSGIEYKGEFTLTNVSEDITVKAIAYAEGKKKSAIAEATLKVTLKPRMPKVSWNIGSTEYVAEADGEYTVPANTQLTVAAVNGDKVKVVDEMTEESNTFESPYTFTVTDDLMASFYTVSGAMESEPLTVIFSIEKVKPGTPVVTWVKDGTVYTAENEGEYDIYANTTVTVTSADATKISVTTLSDTKEYVAPYSFIPSEDDIYVFTGKNENGVSEEMMVAFSIVERPAEKTYRLVTSTSDLVAGNKYIIACKGADYQAAVGNNGNWNPGKNEYLQAVSSGFRIDDNNVLHDFSNGTTTSEGVMVFTLGGNSSSWTMTADNYICPEGHGNSLAFDETYARMSTIGSTLTFDIDASGNATISGGNATEGYVLKYGETSTRFGLYKSANDFPLVQLYVLAETQKPGMPVVTYTRTLEGESLPTEEYETYTAVNGSTIIVTSENATAIKIGNKTFAAPEGVYTFTTDVDMELEVYGVNEAGESDGYLIEILVDYEAATVTEAHALSLKQRDRKNTALNAPVKFTGWSFITGHYMKNNVEEHVWIEDSYGNATVLFDDVNHDLAACAISLERSTQLRNYMVRSVTYAGESNAMQLISWPENVSEDVSDCAFPTIDQHQGIGKDNEYKCVRLQGDVVFTANGGVMTLANGSTVTVSNVLTFKQKAENTFGRYEENEFNWKPGDEWPTGSMNNIHIAGFVMPTADGYEFYPAHVTDNENNITGVDEIENEDDAVIISNGVIYAPAGSSIFTISGHAVKNGQTVNKGIYVIVLPSGKAMKIAVK